MTKKRTGRPPLDPSDSTVRLTLYLPAKQFDAVYQRARDERQTMPAVVRQVLTRALTPSKVLPEDS